MEHLPITPHTPQHPLESHIDQGDGWVIAWAQCQGPLHPLMEDSIAVRLFPHSTTSSIPPNAPGQALAVCTADGVGGGARGDIASRALADHCTYHLPPKLVGDADGLRAWLGLAEAHVQHALREVTFRQGASTLVAAWLQADGTGHLTHVGDARAYAVRAHALQAEQLTIDQTFGNLPQEPRPNGVHDDDNAHMVGTDSMGNPTLQTLTLHTHDALILCSDGLHRDLPATTLATSLYPITTQQNWAALPALASAWVREAIARGSTDDVSVVVVVRTAVTVSTNNEEITIGNP